MTTTTTTADL